MNKQTKAKTEIESNIKGGIDVFNNVQAQYRAGTIPDRMFIAFKNKLVSLFNDKKSTPEEKSLILEIWANERKKGTISRIDNYVLNAYEYKKLERKCYVRSENTPIVHGLKKHQKCMFEHNPLEGTGEGGRFHVYTERLISPEAQMTQDMAVREFKNRAIKDEEWAKPKIQIRRISFTRKEFNAWFELDGEDIIAQEFIKPLETHVF